MPSLHRRSLMAWSALILACALTGCSSSQVRPFAYTDPREMAGRAGLFTGSDGGISFRR